MDDQNLRETLISYSGKDLEERKIWYSPAAEAYDRARPHYPEELIAQVLEITQLPSDAQILEIGCGPGTATVAFAQFGFSMLCLEPNPEFYKLAQRNCYQYSNVEIENTSFEEWVLQADTFDAVLAASSFHWIPPDVGYSKAAKALKQGGFLILLWNKELQPAYETYQQFSKIYQIHAPSLDRYEDRETQTKILQGLGQLATDFGLFENVVFGQIESTVTYTVEDYLTLLDTYSPYLQLDPHSKKALFEGLADTIKRDLGGNLQLFYTSAFHIAQKQYCSKTLRHTGD